IFLLFSFTASSVVVLAKNYLAHFLGLKTGLKTDILLRYIMPFILVFLTFTVIYVIIPRIRISWLNAFKGALLVTVMWEAAKYFFTWYVRNVTHLGTIYGSLTTFILFLVWFYYSSCIFLFGAEVVNNLQRKA
ncbi:MAG: YihY/virulence factor BrkB family protein, partial [Nitrospirae bacterium]|nr:YihY/virulence factor BrkB family protein [Nitrospirota bacterium]